MEEGTSKLKETGFSSDALEDMEEEEPQESDLEENESEDSTVKREQRLLEYHKSCQYLISFLKTNKIPSSLEKKNHRNIRNQAKTHIWDETEKKLYYVGTKKGPRKLVLTDSCDIDSAIQEGHVKPDGVHMGINNTLAAVSRSFVWMSMKMDVANYVASCQQCQSKHRSSGDKMNKPDPIDYVQVDMQDEAEFSYEATVLLIEAIKKHQEDLSNRQMRLQVFKEVQENLAHRGHSFSVGAVRQKWNNLVEMHKRMRREIYQKNPPWQFYMMMETIDNQKSASAERKVHPSNEEQTSANYPHHEMNYQAPQNNAYISNTQGSLYSTQHGSVYPSHHANVYPFHQSQSFDNHPTHQSNTSTVVMPHTAFYKGNVIQSRIQPDLNHPIRLPSVPHDLNSASVDHQTMESVAPIRREVQRLGAQQTALHNQMKETSIQCIKTDAGKRKGRMERLMLRHLRKMGKELQAISTAQSQILCKQDQLLNAVLGRR